MSGNVASPNRHAGSNFDDFLEEEGIYDKVRATALKRALVEQLEDRMRSARLTKLEMARRMATSRAQLDRVLDPDNGLVRLDTLIKVARAVGADVEIRLRRRSRRPA